MKTDEEMTVSTLVTSGIDSTGVALVTLNRPADRARFNAAFRGAGLSGDFGGIWTLPRIIGIGRARKKYLLSEPCDAQEALRIGLVSKVWPAEQLL
ncbi:enoyl-CoA hydratase-related protein [Streptomyces sp. NPDC059455]|uniref:enoyl-CoA hydratase-related protein n=1 Tax=Streptomyces sp. NPDC059455 TaxID=3346837 RepID=UPI00369AFF00